MKKIKRVFSFSLSILMTMAVFTGMAFAKEVPTQEPEHIYLEPVQVAPNRYEYRDEYGTVVAWATTEETAQFTATEFNLEERLSNVLRRGSDSFSFQLGAYGYDHYGDKVPSGTWDLTYSIYPSTGGTGYYVGLYSEGGGSGSYSWLKTRHSGPAVKWTFYAAGGFYFSIKNDSGGRFAGTCSYTYT